MQRITGLIIEKARKLLEDGTVSRVLGWKNGEFFYDQTPAVFHTSDEFSEFVYDGFCGANLSKYLVQESKKEGKILALLKSCDTYSFNQLVKENQIIRENVYILGIECPGMLDINKVKDKGIKGIQKIEENKDELLIETLYGPKSCKRDEILLEKCLSCKGKQHVAYDELVLTNEDIQEPETKIDRFEMIEKIEDMTPDERFAFWRDELSKCIRCNACRNVCPACTCIKCIFDNDKSGIASKANTDTFEENMFHIIRAFHVAGRCTDCGECSRVCPQHIPLHLLNRKIIKDINEFYGEYQAGVDTETPGPLTNYRANDVEPSIIMEKGGRK